MMLPNGTQNRKKRKWLFRASSGCYLYLGTLQESPLATIKENVGQS